MQHRSIPVHRANRRDECSRTRRRGATLVEFAVVAPLVFFMVFLFVEFDRYLLTVHALDEAARVGCRLAVLEGSTLVQVKTEVDRILSPFGISKHELSITPDLATAIGSGNPVSVKLEIAYNDVSWLPAPTFLSRKTITVTSTLPKEK